jgi:hypothetical protein
MNHIYRITPPHLVIAVLFVFTYNALAQSPVNKVWHTSFGEPLASFDWTASAVDAAGFVYTTGNTRLSNGKIAAYTTKHDSLGNLVWDQEFEATGIDASYGVAIQLDGSGNVYVAGAAYSASSLHFDFLVIKYENDGDQVWYATRNGTGNGDDYASALIVDGAQNVYVTGPSKGVGTQMDFMTLKLYANGTAHWAKRYDYAQFDEAPVAIRFLNATTIEVSGGSASSDSTWDIAAVRYKLPTGLSGPNYRREAFDIDFERPLGLARDEQGDFYVCGSAPSDSTGYDMVFARLDTSLNVIWDVTFDGGGFDDAALNISLDDNGDVLATGYAGLDSSGQQTALATLKLAGDDGDLLWKKTYGSLAATGRSFTGRRVISDEAGNVIVAGEVTEGSLSHFLTLKYDSQGRYEWERSYTGDSTGLNRPTAVLVTGEGETLVGGLSAEGGTPTYVWIKYEDFKRDEEYVPGPDSLPAYALNEVIVRFSPHVVNTAFVDNLSLNWGRVEQIITDTALIALMDSTLGAGGLLNRWKLVRIFHNLKSTTTHLTGRTGESVQIPRVWSAFILNIGEAEVKHPVSVSLALDSLPYRYIRYAHPNYALRFPAASLLSGANDPLYDDQHSLWDTPEYDNANINIEPAWDIVDGAESWLNREVKIAQFDTGVQFTHEDLGCEGCPGLNGSVVTRALWFNADTIIDLANYPVEELDVAPLDPEKIGHGTRAAGIMAAVRNNEKGIAGIAGGNAEEGQPGVLLNSYRLTYTNPLSTLETLVDAMEYDFEEPDGGHIFCIETQIIQCPFPGCPQPSDVKLLREVVEIAYDLEIIQTTARGNFGHMDNNETVIYPAMYKDNWLISVGASGTDGEHLDNESEDGPANGSLGESFRSSYGASMDLIAPGTSDIILSTVRNSINNTTYTFFNGTSASLPHATGTVALLLYHSRDELSQEDVERLLEYSSSDITGNDPVYPTGYDIYNGWGRLNAGRALEMIDPEHEDLRVVHFEFEGDYLYEDIVCSGQTECPFMLTNGYRDLCTEETINNTSSAILRKVYVPFNIPISSEYGIEPVDLDDPDKPAWWVRSSAVGLWAEPVYDSLSGQYIVTPGNELFFDEEPVYENGYLEGVIAGYQILVDPNYLGCTLDTTFPEEVLTFPAYFTGPPKLKFSLLASTPSDFVGPVVISSQREPEKVQLPVVAYPNPAKHEVQIRYELEQVAPVSLAIFNAGGQLVHIVDYVTQPPGQYTQTVGLHNLAPGVYFCALVSDRFYHTTKLIKL